MKHLRRWSIVLTVLLLLLPSSDFFIRYYLVKQIIIAEIKHRTGKEVTIEKLEVNRFLPHLTAENILLTDPKLPQNTIHVKTVKVLIPPKDVWNAIVHRQISILTLEINGIDVRVHSADGHQFIPDTIWKNAVQNLPKAQPDAGGFDWLKILSENPGEALLGIAGQSETKRLIAAQKERWQKQIDRMKQQNTINLLSEIPALRQQAETDFRQLQETAQRDKISLQNMQMPKLNSNAITASLVEKQIKKYWESIFVWHDALRKFIVGDKPPEKGSKPWLHIVAANFNGQIVFDTLPVYFNGRISEFVQPYHFEDSMGGSIVFSGDGIPSSCYLSEDTKPSDSPVPETYVSVTMRTEDGKESVALQVHSPSYRLTAQQLGDPANFAINVSPGLSQSLGYAKMIGADDLTCYITLLQNDIQLLPVLPPAAQNTELAMALRQSLSQVHELKIQSVITGNKDNPQFQFTSNLGDLLVPQMESLLTAGFQSAKTKLDLSMTMEANQGAALLNNFIKEAVNPPAQGLPNPNVPQPLQKPVDDLIQRGIQKLLR